MPEWREEISRRLAESGLRAEQQADVVDEISQHLDDRYRELMAAGHDDAAARRMALDELDAGDTLAREVQRALPHVALLPPPGGPEQRSWFAGLRQDIAYAFRRLRSRPLFTLTAVATVALTIGPATAVIGMADALFFTPKPGISQPDRLFLAQFGRPGRRAGSFSPTGIPASLARQIGAGGGAISAIAGQQRTTGDLAADGVEPKRLSGTAVQPGYFELLGARMAAGRTLLPEEDAVPGGVPSLVLAEGASRDMFGTPDAAIGKTVQINSVPFTVVGVAAAPFEGAVGASNSGFRATPASACATSRRRNGRTFRMRRAARSTNTSSGSRRARATSRSRRNSTRASARPARRFRNSAG